MPTYRVTELSSSYFKQLEDWYNDNLRSAEEMMFAIDRTMMGYAYVTVGAAQRRSAGPLDPRSTNTRYIPTGHYFVGSQAGSNTPARRVQTYTVHSPLAWKIPVRRITGAYYKGWYARRVAPGIWEVSNKSREAYYIEYGINHIGTGAVGPAGQRVRIRRPILKLSVLEALTFAQGHGTQLTGPFGGVSGGASRGKGFFTLSSGGYSGYQNPGQSGGHFIYGASARGNVPPAE